MASTERSTTGTAENSTYSNQKWKSGNARTRTHHVPYLKFIFEIDDEELAFIYLPLSVWATASCLPSVLPPLFIELRLEPGDDPQPPASPGFDLGVWSES